MKKRMCRVLALCLVLCLLLSGCQAIGEYFSVMGSLLMGGSAYRFSDMNYVRPDLERFQANLDACCLAAETERDLQKLLDQIYAFYTVFDEICTAQALSMIHYSKNMADAYWEAEYQFCSALDGELTAGLDRLYRALAKSPLRPQLEGEAYFGADFFVAYEGESLYDEAFCAMLAQESQLQNQYLALYATIGQMEQAAFLENHAETLAEVLAQLVILRRQMAEYAGYDSYPEFAYEFYHARDYTPAQTTAYLADIRAELVPLFQQIAEKKPEITLYSCTQTDTYEYVRQTANGLGGTFLQAFWLMEQSGLYDIAAGEEKYAGSFEVYIADYQVPYVFVSPTETEYDKLTFAHEFGHFCNDYASYGGQVGVDVAEVFSQGTEYMSLLYGPADANLTKLKMLDGLCVYVEQGALASFEQQLYTLAEEELNAQGMQALYSRVCTSFGLEGSMEYVLVPHFYTSPLYVISYVVSNDAALQIYQMEQAATGTGRKCLEESLYTSQGDFLAFLEEAGLKSPFAAGRLAEVKQMLQQILQ